MEIGVLGAIRVAEGGRDVTPTGGRQRRALVALVVAGRDGANADQLAEVIWDDADRPADHGAHLRTVVNRLRRQLGDDGGAASAVVTRPGGYALADDVDVDLWQFDRIVGAASDELDPVRRSDLLVEALGLWRGEPFDEVGDLPQLAPTIAGLADVRLGAEEDLVDALLEQGRPDRAFARVQPLIDDHPYRERLRRTQVLALYRLGRQTEALRALRLHRELMIDELGVAPSPDLDEIEQLVLRHDPSLTGPASGRRSLRGYRLGEIVGSGSDSVVYRAWQPTLDRPVAIKVIRAELVDDPTFIRRFEREAALVARLEHPFIVPLYDYWREPGQAFLVSRLLPRSLADALGTDGSWSLPRVVTLLEQVGAALAFAHASGVVHRDVKPANVLLDDEGNAYLVDFGIASVAEHAPDPRIDVAGLARLAASALGGSVADRPDLTEVAELLALNADADSVTCSTVGELVGRLAEATGATAPTRADAVPLLVSSPYRGLAPFDASDEPFLAGRADVIAEMRARWSSGERLMVLAGASGVGKSSVVRAGFLPALGRGEVDGSDRWFVAAMTPGADPLAALADALSAVAVRADAEVHRVLRRPDRPIAAAVEEAFGRHDADVVIVIDQLEELYSMAPADAARRFTDAIAEALDDDELQLRVVATLRADFFARPLGAGSFGRRFRSSVVPVGPLDAAALEVAITAPAAAVGVRCEPALVATLVADVSQNPNALPLLQLTLTDLFAERTADGMTMAGYERLGGLAGALVRRGESLIDDVGPDGAEQVRTTFGQLVDVGDGAAPVRRRVPLASLVDLGVPATLVERVVDSRLVVLDRDARSRAPTVEVTHESVLTEWPRLASWLEEDRELLGRVAVLQQAAAAWDQDGRDDSGLLRGRRLEAAEDVAAVVPLTSSTEALVAASRAQRDAERRRERSRRRLLTSTTVVAVVVAIAAVAAGVVAIRSRGAARDEAERAVEQQTRADEAAARASAAQDLAEERAAAADEAAEAEQLAAERADEAAASAALAADEATTAALARSAQAIARTQPVLARQLAVEAIDRSDDPATRQALAVTLASAPGLVERVAGLGASTCEALSTGSGPEVAALAMTSDGDGGASVTVVDVESGRIADPIDVSDVVRGGTLRNTSCPTPNRTATSVLLVGDDALSVVRADGSTARAGPVDRASWTNDQRSIVGVEAGAPATLRLLSTDDLTTLSRLEVLFDGPRGAPSDVRANDELALLADGSFRAVLVDLESGEQRYLTAGARDIAVAVDISDQGGVAAALGERVVSVWDLDSGADPAPLAIEPLGSPLDLVGTTGPANRPVLSPSGDRVALITSIGVEIFDITSGEAVVAPIESAVSSGAVRFTGDDEVVVLTAAGELLRYRLDRLAGLGSPVLDVPIDGGLFDESGSTITTVEQDETGAPTWVAYSLADGDRTELGPLGFSREVNSVDSGVAVGFDPIAGVFERLEDGAVTHRVELGDEILAGNIYTGQSIRVDHGIAMLNLRGASNVDNPTGQIIAIDVDTGEVRAVLDIPGLRRSELLSADEFVHGDFVGGVTIRSFAGEVVERLPAFASSVQTFAGTVAGDLLLGLDDGTTLVWSRAEGRVVRELAGPPETVTSVHEAADGTIVSQYLSGRIVGWWPDSDVLGVEVLGPVGYRGPARVVDDRVLVAAGDGVVDIPLDIGVWRSMACASAGEDVDPVRWRAVAGTDVPQPPPCS